MLEFSNGNFDLAKIALGKPSDQAARYHLYSNDKNQPWINVSYYMPFLYRVFAKLDRAHPWNELANDAYQDMHASLFAKLTNNKNETFSGTGRLPPNWLTYNELGQIVDLPWAVDGFIDDYMSGWDAFRTWYFMAADKRWHRALAPDFFLKGESYSFFKNELDKFGKLNVGYTIAGEKRDVNWVGQSTAGSNGSYLAFFLAAGDLRNAEKLLADIVRTYISEGFWETPDEYYKQNWAWLGLAFYAGLGDELFAEIERRETI